MVRILPLRRKGGFSGEGRGFDDGGFAVDGDDAEVVGGVDHGVGEEGVVAAFLGAGAGDGAPGGLEFFFELWGEEEFRGDEGDGGADGAAGLDVNFADGEGDDGGGGEVLVGEGDDAELGVVVVEDSEDFAGFFDEAAGGVDVEDDDGGLAEESVGEGFFECGGEDGGADFAVEGDEVVGWPPPARGGDEGEGRGCGFGWGRGEGAGGLGVGVEEGAVIVGGEDGFDLVARDVGGLGVVGLENGFGGGDGEDFAGEEGVVGAQEDVGAGGGHGKEEEERGEMELHVRHNRGLAPEKGSRWRGAEARTLECVRFYRTLSQWGSGSAEIY